MNRISRNSPKAKIEARRQSKFYLLGLGFLCLFAFQNCMRPGFEVLNRGHLNAPTIAGTSVDTGSGSAGTGSGSGSGSGASTRSLLGQLTLTELIPVEVTLNFAGTLAARSLPRGAMFDNARKTFLWLPQKGQAGQYAIDFDAVQDGKPVPFQLRVAVAPVADEILNAGPLDLYNDGDLGYVFVHGMGDVDRCSDRADLAAYWLDAPKIIAPDEPLRTVACYDGRRAANDVAASVAQQIIDAKCGRYEKCVAVTHSMGGLVLEFIVNHARPALPTDPEPNLFAQHELFKRAKDRLAFIVSIASAAGGSKVASILESPGKHEAVQAVVGRISRWMGDHTDSSKSVTVQRATELVPIEADPGIPVFMVAGYTKQTVREARGVIGGIFDTILDDLPDTVYNRDQQLAALDTVVEFNSRSDGLTDFRSACGIKSRDQYGGPGSNANLEKHLAYCFFTERKPNHYVWFVSNINHFLISTNWWACGNPKNTCDSIFPDMKTGNYTSDLSVRGKSSVEVMRIRLQANRYNLPRSAMSLNLDELPSAK